MRTRPSVFHVSAGFWNHFVIASFLLWAISANAAVLVTDLQCDYLTDPLGIDTVAPHFTWKITDTANTRGQRQTGYQVLVASSPALLEKGIGDVWNSGEVTSSQSALVPFAGKTLASGLDCHWKVRIFDKDKQPSAWSSPARFSMGLLDPTDWSGPWIKHPTAAEVEHIWFRKSFSLREKPSLAMIYVASVGYHELYVNGQKVDTRVLAPALTRLDRRVLYVTYDITRALHAGNNCVAVWTGPGWSRYSFFNTGPALRVQLNAKLIGGNAVSLASGPDWRCEASDSQDIGGCEYRDHGGEQINAQKYEPGWNTVGYDDSGWAQAATTTIPATLSAQMVAPSRIIGTIPAQTISGTGPYKVDLGTNFSGWISVRMKSQAAGDVVTFQVSDNPDTVQAFGQKSIYICKGGPAETFENRFNYAAGRYLTITGLREKPELSDIAGQVIGTDLERAGHFTCSSELFNTIYETDLRTFRANTVEGYTQDCPHRERQGYGEQQFGTAWGCGIPNYDAGAFYVKVLRDWCDVQDSNGWINQTAPQVNRHYGGPMWSSAPLNISWEFYKNYGDKDVLTETYATDKAWLDFLAANTAGGLLQPYNTNYNGGGNFLGDWAEPYQPGDRLKGKEFGTTREALLFNNCVYAMNLSTFVKIAGILGESNDVVTYGKRFEDLKAKVQESFFNPEQNTYLDSRQIHLAFPMFAGITPEDVKPAVYANFEREIQERRPYLDMGSSGLPILLKFLIEDTERDDILFTLLSKTNEPSYGYFLSRGETTWPEYWDDQRASRIHDCYTGIAAWFIKGLGGIREDPDCFGYQSFVIKPAMVGNLTFANADIESLYGMISSHWKKQNGTIELDVAIPVNSTATVYVPAVDANDVTESGAAAARADGVEFLKMEGPDAVFRVQSGVYRFFSK